MIRVEASGEHQTRGKWIAHRTFLGMWAIAWLDPHRLEEHPGAEQVELVVNLPEGAFIRGCGCTSERRCA